MIGASAWVFNESKAFVSLSMLSPRRTPASTTSSEYTTPKSWASFLSCSISSLLVLRVGASSVAERPRSLFAIAVLSVWFSMSARAENTSANKVSWSFIFPLTSTTDTPNLSNDSAYRAVPFFASSAALDKVLIPICKPSTEAPD